MMEAQSTVEMEGTTSLEALFSEHNYFKTQAAADDVELMETAESSGTPLDPTQTQSLSLTQLDSSKDTFETCLIQLLHAYTTNQRGGTTSPPSAASTPQSEVGASGGGEGGVSKGGVGGASGEAGGGQATPAPFIDISPESLSSLSPEQVSVLVTSNSVNYEVIQQIMAQKQGYQGIPMKAASLIPGNGNGGGQLDPDAASNNNGSSGQSSRQQTPDGVSPSPTAMAAAAGGGGGGGGGGVVSKGLSGSDDTPPMGSPSGVLSQQILKNPLQITPEHLQLLQQQVNDLLRSKQISLPADMTSQQQQTLIHNILLKQLKEKQQGASATPTSTSAASVSGVSSLAQPPPSSSAANSNTSSSLATPSVSVRKGTSGTVIAVVKKDPSPSMTSLSLGNLLSSSNMSGPSVVAVKVKEEKKEMNPTSASPAVAPPPQSTPPPSLPDTKPSLTSLPVPPPPSAPAPVPVSSSSTAVKQPPLPEPSASATAAAKASSSSSTPAPAGPSSSTSPPTTRTSASKSGGGGGRGKRKGESNKNEPKKPPMPYNIFFSEVYSTVLAANPKMTFADASRIISMMWNAMGNDVKQKYYERHEELKKEYQANLKKFKEQEQQQLQQEKEREGEAPQPIKTEDAQATSPENKEGNLLQCAESAVESGDLEDEAMEITQHEVKDPSLCVNHGCTNKAVFEKDRGPQYCSNECVVMDTRNVFASWVRNRRIRE